LWRKVVESRYILGAQNVQKWKTVDKHEQFSLKCWSKQKIVRQLRLNYPAEQTGGYETLVYFYSKECGKRICGEFSI